MRITSSPSVKYVRGVTRGWPVLAPRVWKKTIRAIGSEVSRPLLQRYSVGSTRGTTFFRYHAAHRMPTSVTAALAARRVTTEGVRRASSGGTGTGEA